MAKKKIPALVKQVKAYKPPFIDFSKQKVISHTQMTIFNGCEFRWGLTYRDGHKIPNYNINLLFGIVLHEVIQHYLTTFYEKSGAEADRIDLESLFKLKLKQEYVVQYNKNNKIHFSNPAELDEYCLDGLEIIRYFKRKRGEYFSKKGWFLLGCEIPVSYDILPNVLYKGALDLVLYHEPTNTVEIIDLKSSTRAWYDKSKKDENKLSQLVLYKKLFSEQFNFPIDNISIKFMILKRKIKEDGDFPEKRIQEFIPASGKVKLKKAFTLLENFAHSAFDQFGKIKTDPFKKHISPSSCQFCPYKEDDKLCPKGKTPAKWRNPFEIF